MSGADWDLISECMQFPNSTAEILAEHKQREVKHERLASIAAKDQQEQAALRGTQAISKRKPSPVALHVAPAGTQAVADDAQALQHAPATVPVGKRSPDPVTLLLQALDNAIDDAERERLLQGAPYEVRTALNTCLGYRAFIDNSAREIEAERLAHAEFTAALDACETDDQRATLIQCSDPAWLAEYSWRCTANAGGDAWARRYLREIGADRGL